MCLSRYSYQAAVLGCSATNRFVTVEAARAIRVADGGLLGQSLPCHHCGCSLQVSSAVLCDQCRFLPEMVLYHSVLGKIIPEELSCPHFLLFLYYCFILLMFLQGRVKEV